MQRKLDKIGACGFWDMRVIFANFVDVGFWVFVSFWKLPTFGRFRIFSFQRIAPHHARYALPQRAVNQGHKHGWYFRTPPVYTGSQCGTLNWTEDNIPGCRTRAVCIQGCPISDGETREILVRRCVQAKVGPMCLHVYDSVCMYIGTDYKLDTSSARCENFQKIRAGKS